MISWIKKLITKKMVKRTVGSVTRSALLVLAGWLAGTNAPPEITDELYKAIPRIAEHAGELAVVLYGAMQGWSLVQKAKD